MLDAIVNVLDRRRAENVNDHATVVSVVSWVLLVAMIFTLLARMTMKMAYARKGHRFAWDDVFIILAAVSATLFMSCFAQRLRNAAVQHWPDNRSLHRSSQCSGPALHCPHS